MRRVSVNVTVFCVLFSLVCLTSGISQENRTRIQVVGGPGLMSLGINEVQGEYMFPMGKASIAPEVGVGALFDGSAWMLSVGAKCYPFNQSGKGFFLNLLGTYFMTNETWGNVNFPDIRLDIGYRWIFLKHITATIEAGGLYLPFDEKNNFGPSVLISLGGCF